MFKDYTLKDMAFVLVLEEWNIPKWGAGIVGSMATKNYPIQTGRNAKADKYSRYLQNGWFFGMDFF